MNWLAAILFIVGSALVLFGLFQVWSPLPWIVGGLLTLRVAYVTAEGSLT